MEFQRMERLKCRNRAQHQMFSPHAGFLLLTWKPVQLLNGSVSRGLLQKSCDYPFIVMNPNPPQSYLLVTPHLCWLKKYEMKPGKWLPVKAPFSALNTMPLQLPVMKLTGVGQPVSSAAIAGTLEKDSPQAPDCVQCFIGAQSSNDLWSNTRCALHTSSGVLLESSWGEEGLGGGRVGGSG